MNLQLSYRVNLLPFIFLLPAATILGQEFFDPNPSVSIGAEKIDAFLSGIPEIDTKAEYYNLSKPVLQTILVVQSNAGTEAADGQFNYARVLPNKRLQRFESFSQTKNGFVACEKRSRGVEAATICLHFLRANEKTTLADAKWLTLVFGPGGDLNSLAAEADNVYKRLTGKGFQDLGLAFGAKRQDKARTQKEESKSPADASTTPVNQTPVETAKSEKPPKQVVAKVSPPASVTPSGDNPKPAPPPPAPSQNVSNEKKQPEPSTADHGNEAKPALSTNQVGSWSSVTEASTWINSAIKNIQQDDKKYEQKLWVESKNYNFITLSSKETSSKGSVTSNSYEFYYGHLDADKTDYKIKGTAIDVFLYAKSDLPVIKIIKDGTVQGYKNKMDIKCDDIQQARDLIEALNYSINNSSAASPEFQNTNEAITWLVDAIKKVNFSNENFDQKLQFFEDQRNKMVLRVIENTSKSSTDWQYTFYPNDFNEYGSSMDVSGDKIVLKFKTIDNQKMIKVTKNGEQQKFDSDFQVYVDDPKMAMDILSTFKIVFAKQSGNSGNTNNDISAVPSSKKLEKVQKAEQPAASPKSKPEKVEQPDTKPIPATEFSQKIEIDEPEFSGEIILVDAPTGKGVPLELQTASVKSKAGASMYVTGMGKVKTMVSVRGKSSPVRVQKSSKIQFVYNAGDNSKNPKTIIQIFKLEPKKDSRQAEVGSLGTFSGASQGDIDFLEFKAEKYGQSSYLITLLDLPEGEYAFAVGTEPTKQVHLFGVQR